MRKNSRRRLSYSALSGTDYLGLQDHLLSTNLNGKLALGVSRYAPGASTGDDSDQHAGEEAGMVLSGQLTLTIGSKKYILDAGDSFKSGFSLRSQYYCQDWQRRFGVLKRTDVDSRISQ